MAFGWDDAFLLSMSAAGIFSSVKGYQEQKGYLNIGRDLDKAALDANLEALRTQAGQESLSALHELSENISNQIVMNAARGTASGAGSAQTALQKSESNFGKDEQTRRLNLLMKENNLRAGGILSAFQTLESETKLGQSLTSQIFNSIPFSSLAAKFKSGKTNKSGFGLNEV